MTAAPMQALAISMVKNEADIIEASVRHNLHFVDLMVVIDNRSTDGTREILQALRREGLPLVLLDDPVFGHFQSEKVTQTYRMVAPVFNPELVYLLDADEFIRAPGRPELERWLETLAPGSLGLMPWSTHLPAPEVAQRDVIADPLRCMGRRRVREEPLYCKAVIRRDPAQDMTLVVDQGNHGARLAGGPPLPAQMAQGASMAHFPVRSVEQLGAKVINGWLACVQRNRHHDVPGEAYQWRKLYEQIVRGQGLDAQELVMVGLDYAQAPRRDRTLERDTVQEPVPARYGELRHLALGRHDALAKVALSMEGALASLPDLSKLPTLDLAPLLDLLEQLGTRELRVTPVGRPWLDGLKALRPNLNRDQESEAQMLVAPELSLTDSVDLAGQLGGQATIRHCVVLWPDQPREPQALQQELQAWIDAGWQPHLLQTLTLRALASTAALRHGAVVLVPALKETPGRSQDSLPPSGGLARSDRSGAAQQADAARARAIVGALCAMAADRHPWIDPPAQCIVYPLQTLGLGQD